MQVKLEFPPGPVCKEIVSSSIWETKSAASGRWYYCSSCQVSVRKEPLDEFVLDYFHSECGVFQTSLHVPVMAWLKMIDDKGAKL